MKYVCLTLFILISIISACVNKPEEEVPRDERCEEYLFSPYTIKHARRIFVERKGAFNDALIIIEGKGSKTDVLLIKSFLSKMKNDPELFKSANERTVNKSGFESMCLKLIETLESPNLQKHQYEFCLNNPFSIGDARNVFKEARGDFFTARYYIKENGESKDIALIESLIKRMNSDSTLAKKITELDRNFIKECEKIILYIQEREKSKK